MNERDISRLLAEREKGTCEVKTPVGFIDVLTATTVYEVKEASQWKAALGQLLAYARSYPQHKAKLYLYGKVAGAQKTLIQEHCGALNIQVVWHREPQPQDLVPSKPKPATSAPTSLSLVLSVFDQSYHVRSTCTCWIAPPQTLPTSETLETYLDEAYAVFDALLDQDLTVTLRCHHEGKFLTHKRERAGSGADQAPVCYRLNISISTERHTRMLVSLPAMRRSLPSGYRIGRYRHGLSTDIPELVALFAFIRHPDFPWVNKLGMRVVGIDHAIWVSYGMKQTRNGYKIGR